YSNQVAATPLGQPGPVFSWMAMDDPKPDGTKFQGGSPHALWPDPGWSDPGYQYPEPQIVTEYSDWGAPIEIAGVVHLETRGGRRCYRVAMNSEGVSNGNTIPGTDEWTGSSIFLYPFR